MRSAFSGIASFARTFLGARPSPTCAGPRPAQSRCALCCANRDAFPAPCWAVFVCDSAIKATNNNVNKAITRRLQTVRMNLQVVPDIADLPMATIRGPGLLLGGTSEVAD